MQLHRAREQFEQAGVGLVLVGQATPRHAQHFAKKLGLDGLTVLADEDRSTYKAVGLRRANLGQLLGPKSVMSGIKHGRRSGVVQGKIIGDAAQLGGAIVVTPAGEVVFRQASENAGDTIEPADLLDAAKAATAAQP